MQEVYWNTRDFISRYENMCVIEVVYFDKKGCFREEYIEIS